MPCFQSFQEATLSKKGETDNADLSTNEARRPMLKLVKHKSGKLKLFGLSSRRNGDVRKGGRKKGGRKKGGREKKAKKKEGGLRKMKRNENEEKREGKEKVEGKRRWRKMRRN